MFYCISVFLYFPVVINTVKELLNNTKSVCYVIFLFIAVNSHVRVSGADVNQCSTITVTPTSTSHNIKRSNSYDAAKFHKVLVEDDKVGRQTLLWLDLYW